MRHLGMAVKVDRGAGKFCAGVDAGMREFIDQDEIVRSHQSRDDAGIGEITRTEHTSRRAALEPRQPRFERVVERMIAGDQPRSAGADAVTRGRVDRGGNYVGMLAEIEIIVAGKGQEAAAIALGPDAGTRSDHRRAAQLRPVQGFELFAGKFIERTHRLP